MSARDRKLVMVLAPLAVLALYWMALLNPMLSKRSEIQEPLANAEVQRDQAVARVAELEAFKRDYKAHYTELVKLSDAIPQTVGVSDLMRELNTAAEGTGIEFTKIVVAEEDPATTSSTEPGTPLADGLDEIPLELTFEGRFFGLADLFRSLQQFVRTADGKLEVRGRLVRIDSFSFNSAEFPNVTAQISATVYAAPAAEGATGGASPVGPPGAERGDGTLEPVGNFETAASVRP